MRTPARCARSPSDCSAAQGRPRRARPRSHSRGRRPTIGPVYPAFPSSSSDEDDEAAARAKEEYYLLRNFAITGKGVVNRGDSVRSRRSSADSNDCPR